MITSYELTDVKGEAIDILKSKFQMLLFLNKISGEVNK